MAAWGEVSLVLVLLAISALLSLVVASQRVVLGFYTLPTVFSAYFYGRRHATLTALASVLLVVLVTQFKPSVLGSAERVVGERWYDISVWGGILLITAYAMGTLYRVKEAHLQELRETYHGVLLILRQFLAKDEYTQNHSYRVAVYGTKIAAHMGLDEERIEDLRAAALLHDIGKLGISRELLYKASRLTGGEYEEMKQHVPRGVSMLKPVGGTLRRVIPIVLAHHDKFDGSGYRPKKGEEIPLEARILAVADAYDVLTSDRPYRRAISPFAARDTIVSKAGSDFDPEVVESFQSAFRAGEMEMPSLVV